MTRYLRQHDKFSCGPTAIMNVLKWLGLKIHYRKEIEWFREITRCKEDGILFGTNFGHMTKALKMFKNLFTTEYRRDPTVSRIAKHLNAGGVVVLCYRLPKRKVGHYILIVEANGEGFTAVNVEPDRTRTKLSSSDLSHMLLSNGIYPRAWLITKKKGRPKSTP